MTNTEREQQMQEAWARFYSWKPPNIYNPFQTFRCWHIQPYPMMSEEKCKARARKPEIFENAGCSLKCPRWKHYRKLFKKENNGNCEARKAYPAHRGMPDER